MHSLKQMHLIVIAVKPAVTGMAAYDYDRSMSIPKVGPVSKP